MSEREDLRDFIAQAMKRVWALEEEARELGEEIWHLRGESQSYILALQARVRSRDDEIARLRNLISDHHAVGVMDDALVGDACPVCAGER